MFIFLSDRQYFLQYVTNSTKTTNSRTCHIGNKGDIDENLK